MRQVPAGSRRSRAAGSSPGPALAPLPVPVPGPGRFRWLPPRSLRPARPLLPLLAVLAASTVLFLAWPGGERGTGRTGGTGGTGGADGPEPLPEPALRSLLARLDPARLWGSLLRPLLHERVPGGPGSRAAREHILSHLRSLGAAWHLELDTFTARTPRGPVTFSSVVATAAPGDARRLALACHYDTKVLGDTAGDSGDFVGATDAAVPCALLLEVAAALDAHLRDRERQAPPLTLQLLFLDGEEAFEAWSDSDSLYGARHLAAKMAARGHPAGSEVTAMSLFVLLDLLGAPHPAIHSHCVTVSLCHCQCQCVTVSLCPCVTLSVPSLSPLSPEPVCAAGPARCPLSVTVSLCPCVTVSVPVSLCHCQCPRVPVSLCHCHCVTVSLCHCVTVTVSLCPCVTVSLCPCVTVSLCHCQCVPVSLSVSPHCPLCPQSLFVLLDLLGAPHPAIHSHCVTVSLSLCPCVTVSLCHCHCVPVSLCHCVTVTVSLCPCVTVTVSLCHCVTVSLSLCHCVTVSLSLCPCVTVPVSLCHCVPVSLCHCHCVTVSLCHCQCVPVSLSVSPLSPEPVCAAGPAGRPRPRHPQPLPPDPALVLAAPRHRAASPRSPAPPRRPPGPALLPPQPRPRARGGRSRAIPAPRCPRAPRDPDAVPAGLAQPWGHRAEPGQGHGDRPGADPAGVRGGVPAAVTPKTQNPRK
uniref:glutaminyl-peptide cyclotransferase n=1 Tax=Catharus ustulatus TaxID=91951 RepID=A0A8C3UC17_CATUS